MLPPFRMGVGGKLGSGQQWMPWIHLADLAALFQFAVETPVRGALNGAAPHTDAKVTKDRNVFLTSEAGRLRNLGLDALDVAASECITRDEDSVLRSPGIQLL